MTRRTRSLQTIVHHDPLQSDVALACAEISPSTSTRLAYKSDFDLWFRFCQAYDIEPRNPREGSVAAFVEWMRSLKHAPKSRARRISSLSSIYRHMRRARKVSVNPFSVDEGPKRERANPLEPTPVASPDAIRRVLATCDDSELGIRDAAIIRILWGTGIRRASVISMAFEKLRKDRNTYLATVIGKGDKPHRILIRGKTFEAFDRWIGILRDAKLSSGPIWRTKTGVMSERALGHMLERRSKRAGIEEQLSPHTFRVSFLTYNPAGIEAKQDAAGHADPATTRLYDRASWRGREAFEQMPELEDIGDPE